MRMLTIEGMKPEIAKRIARVECSKRRALAPYIGNKAARSGQLLISYDQDAGDNGSIRIQFSIDDDTIRNDFDRLVLALILRSGV